MPTSKSHCFSTKVGDVLILHTDSPSTIYAVGPVLKDGQQDFSGSVSIEYVADRVAAVAKAKALVRPERRTLLWNLDSSDWSEILV